MPRLSPRTYAMTNKLLPCENAKRCGGRKRHWTGNLCSTCQQRRNHHGHENAEAVYKYHWRHFIKPVQEIFDANANDPALLAALEIAENLITPGPEVRRKILGPGADRWHLRKELRRLQHHVVTPRAALEAICASWALCLEQPARFPRDRHVTFILSNAVLALAPYRKVWAADGQMTRYTVKRPAGVALALLGQQIRDGLGPFALRVFEAIGERTVKENDEKAAKLNTLGRKLAVPPPKLPRVRKSAQVAEVAVGEHHDATRPVAAPVVRHDANEDRAPRAVAVVDPDEPLAPVVLRVPEQAPPAARPMTAQERIRQYMAEHAQ